MTLDLSTVVQALVVVITSASAYYLRSVLNEVAKIGERVNKHSESLAAGYARFEAMEQRIKRLEDDFRARVPS